MARYNRFAKFQATCVCGRTTTKAYIRQHGQCKACVTGVATPNRKRDSYDAIAREGGYEDTMGVSPEALEPAYYGDY